MVAGEDNAQDFDGAKLAVMCDGVVLSLMRDNRPDIPFPGLWDLPGGGREGDETAEDCALRETLEETGLRLDPAWIVWKRLYPNANDLKGPRRWFLVAEVPADVMASARLGDEGQALRWFGVAEFLSRPDAIPHLQRRLRDFLTGRAERG
ncbi:NUDIX domain-containing protein [Psychromarinibacter sp. S121]|uniref:NUDIX domain-containing protein n=1 Tax=Psychromarinibacter sp. S121 TaxID=3415127 RepID=UPI003C7D20CF